jgi:osmotically-inducible protein OsmY
MSNNNDLQQAVQAELKWDPMVTAANIGVTAKDGVVTLSGYVDTYAGKLAAEAAASRVNGVKAVAEEIKVHLLSDMKTSDQDIAAAAIHRLTWNVYVPRDSVKVKVEKGWVTLTGQVSAGYQKDEVGDEIRPLTGVVGVSNQVTVKSSVDTSTLSDDINHALNRSWFFNPDDVDVSASGGRVTLRGTVDTYYERNLAETTAWAASGVTSVENDLEIA